jgi:hypothetical protein
MRIEGDPGGAGAGRREVLPFVPPPEHAQEEEPIDPLRRELRPILKRRAAVFENLTSA